VGTDTDGYAFDRRVTVRIERSSSTSPEAVAKNE